jgi:hypothetical protein
MLSMIRRKPVQPFLAGTCFFSCVSLDPELACWATIIRPPQEDSLRDNGENSRKATRFACSPACGGRESFRTIAAAAFAKLP